MYLALLGRQPEISLAELERVFGSEHVAHYSENSALIDTPKFDIEKLGGVLKAGLVLETVQSADWHIIEKHILKIFAAPIDAGKITVGLSVYGQKTPPKSIQKTGLKIKNLLKIRGHSVRLISSNSPSLSTASSHHNKLGLSPNKIELIISTNTSKRTVICTSVGSQNITSYVHRDRSRPKRDPFVGMLPPKLAQIMVNLAAGQNNNLRILDPFCGTGVLLQEAVLMGHKIYGTDLSEKMIEYTRTNLHWLAQSKKITIDPNLSVADATVHLWNKPIDAVATESYLGQPFSAPPRAEKLEKVVMNCDHIIKSFLKNIGGQIKPGTELCVAIPAWRNSSGRLTHLPLTNKLDKLGYKRIDLRTCDSTKLIYYRENQIVARELLLLSKT